MNEKWNLSSASEVLLIVPPTASTAMQWMAVPESTGFGIKTAQELDRMYAAIDRRLRKALNRRAAQRRARTGRRS